MKVADYQLGLIKKCLSCSLPLSRKPKELAGNWRNRNFCDPGCWYKRNVGLVKLCENCDSKIIWGKNFYNKRFCSIRCVVKWREQQNFPNPHRNKFKSGNENPNWTGGVTSENEKVRKSSIYKQWRKAVFERDNYTCQFCQKRGGELNADHILPFAFFTELRFELSNGRTLCVPCHRSTFFGNKL